MRPGFRWLMRALWRVLGGLAGAALAVAASYRLIAGQLPADPRYNTIDGLIGPPVDLLVIAIGLLVIWRAASGR